MKRNNAITLIALVITIVVLIILAGVAISLSLGENGIFNKAKFATEEYANEQAREEAEIAKTVNDVDYYVGATTRDTVTIPKEEYEQLKKDSKTLIVSGTTPSKADTWQKNSRLSRRI